MTGEALIPERVIARLRPHARWLVLSAVVLVAVTGAASFAMFFFDEWLQRGAVLAGAIVLTVLLCVVPLLRWLSTQYLITTRRIVVRRGLAVRTRQEVLLSRSYDITVRQAGVQSLFRSGDLLINTGLDRPVVLRNVPRAALVQRAIIDVMQASVNSNTAPIAIARRPSQPAAGGGRRARAAR